MNKNLNPALSSSYQVPGIASMALLLMMTLPACVSKAAMPQDQLAHEANVQEDQADVMKTCQVNATAMNLEGDTREYYINGCLLAPVSTHAAHKKCQVNATAMNLEGETRRHYLLSCLARN